MKLTEAWRRLNLWPRLAIAFTLGFVALFGVFSLLAMWAVRDSTERILQERLVIAQMAAREIDGLLERAFYELDKATGFALFDPASPSLNEEYHMLAHAYGRIGALSLGVYFLDAQGKVVLSEPPGKLSKGVDMAGESHVKKALQTGERGVSSPFLDPSSNRPAVALTIPILNADGSLRSILVGVVDVSSAGVLGPLSHARSLGNTGHAELVDDLGLIVASTDAGGFLKPGEHWSYYMRMLQSRSAGVEKTLYVPWHATPQNGPRQHHVMAFAPLSSAPWGIAVGGSDWETFAPVIRLRNHLLLTGALALVIVWVLALVGARLLVRPIRVLTKAATEMASGSLGNQILIMEGGEIGRLGESLEAMRRRLGESLETLRSLGEALEAKVAERTAEVEARNRQLAAITTVATTANEAASLEETLGRCLDIALRHTGMKAAAVRLLDRQTSQLVTAACRGDHSALPCKDNPAAIGACPCGVVASQGAPIYLDSAERKAFSPRCQIPDGQGLWVLPLVSPRGILGVLSLSYDQGALAGEGERQTLAAICNQVAVAVDKARLLQELRRVESQRELERIKAEFISEVSHELRTPLGIIKGYATTLLRDDISVDTETQREFLRVVEEETSKLQKMIDELLDASRIQSGRLTLETRPVDIGLVVQKALGKARLNLELSGHPLITRLSQGGLQVIADPLRIEQVVHNLLDNAAHYSDSGKPIEVAIAAGSDSAMVYVTDYGDGIVAADHESIFEPFHRGENSRRRGVAGTGLGLAICKGIVTAHGGRLWVESSPGKGSTFAFSLPLAGIPQTTGAAPPGRTV